ncbi:PHD finger protein ALFIN-LIKE 7-like [Carex rostrata]
MASLPSSKRVKLDPSASDKVKEVFNNINARRIGILNALMKDLEVVYNECDPVKESLCLFGLTNTTWVVKAFDWESPLSIPEPKLGILEPKPISGINFLRNKMTKEAWASSVAVHSDG